MSRQLPPKANFDYLKKQAKELRAELSREQPDVQLADAQRLLAREYGFTTWAALKAHVTEAPGRALAGTWQVNLSRSKQSAANLFRDATLRFSVQGNAVTIADAVVDESGRTDSNSNTLVVDGRAHEQQYGYAGHGPVDHASPSAGRAYEGRRGQGPRGLQVDSDGRTMTLSTPDSVIQFDRVG